MTPESIVAPGKALTKPASLLEALGEASAEDHGPVQRGGAARGLETDDWSLTGLVDRDTCQSLNSGGRDRGESFVFGCYAALLWKRGLTHVTAFGIASCA